MNKHINVNKFLSICYFLLILPVPFLFPGDLTSLVNLGLSLFYFSGLHWVISKNLLDIKREKIFTFFSALTLLNFFAMALLGLNGGEGAGYTMLVFLFILPVPVILSLFFGLFSLFRTNRKMFYIFLLLIPVTLSVIYFVSNDLHRGTNPTLNGLVKFLVQIPLSALMFLEFIPN